MSLSTANLAIFTAITAVLDGVDRRPAALATVIGRSGSAPQVIGARLLLHDDGQMCGTVGGGAIEAQVLAACRAVLDDRRPRRVAANLVRDLGMCCGGSMDVFVEYLAPPGAEDHV
ncbi:XdhC family protein [Nannocystis punicea]|uniref:XdhC family protein n=1 Tax=Nannocystis punicea TaxID=2995304 RepID=A0ABY7GWB7_9BACT|nr:XdhC family protein [Nannocystis poenicansa]WAS91268.1 XdhC family protein [Nannocystis poenicansa]